MLKVAAVTVGLVAGAQGASAQFQVFQGAADAEAQWRAATGAGDVPIEDFEGFKGTPSPFSGPSDQVTALPALGILFATDTPDAYPGVYDDPQYAHSGGNQLANFGGGLGQYSNYRAMASQGLAIYALGFWQCDPQGSQAMHAYARDGTFLGTIVGSVNNGSGQSFAGFVSATPVARVEVPGGLGDGWNHIDDLQVVTRPSCPADINGDGFVDGIDYDTFNNWFEDPNPAVQMQADYNRDGFVDGIDYDQFNNDFETPCP